MKKGSVLIMLLVCSLGFTTASSPVNALVLEKGSESEHVLDLQQRLSKLGYFKVGITGYFGSVTYHAVKKFQSQSGLPANGKADDSTIALLKQAAPSEPKNDELEQMARIIHSEARGESFEGQVAIGAVVLNRVQSDEFPDSISDVIFQPGQFTAVQDKQYYLTPNQSAYEAAKAALNGADPTSGALYYYNPKTATATWSKKRQTKITIDRHVFTH